MYQFEFFRGFNIQRNAAAQAKMIPAVKFLESLPRKRNAHCAAYMKMEKMVIGTT